MKHQSNKFIIARSRLPGTHAWFWSLWYKNSCLTNNGPYETRQDALAAARKFQRRAQSAKFYMRKRL